MILKHRQLIKPFEGQERIDYHYAWFPTWVGTVKVWLQRYEKVYKYSVRKRCLPYIPGMSKVYYAKIGGWDLIEERLSVPGVPKMLNPPKPPPGNESRSAIH